MKCVLPRKQLADDVKTSMLKFYEDDNFSYQAAGRGDFRKISVNGEIKEVQIRYLVVTLKEAHALFVLNHKEIISFSKSAALCLAHVYCQCDSSHNVCASIIHENVKFLLKVLHKKHVVIETVFQEFISHVVCEQNASECMQPGVTLQQRNSPLSL